MRRLCIDLSKYKDSMSPLIAKDIEALRNIIELRNMGRIANAGTEKDLKEVKNNRKS